MFKNFLKHLFINKNNIQEHKPLTDYLAKNENFIKGSKLINDKINRLKGHFEKELNGEIENKENQRIEYKNDKNKKL